MEIGNWNNVVASTLQGLASLLLPDANGKVNSNITEEQGQEIIDGLTKVIPTPPTEFKDVCNLTQAARLIGCSERTFLRKYKKRKDKKTGQIIGIFAGKKIAGSSSHYYDKQEILDYIKKFRASK